MTDIIQCPICNQNTAEIINSTDYGDKKHIYCRKCGSFQISNSAMAIERDPLVSGKLSSWLKERDLLNIQVPLITSNFLKDVIHTLPDYSPIEKLDKLLRSIELLTKYPGDYVDIHPVISTSLAWATNDSELDYYINSLAERKLIEIVSRQMFGDDPLFKIKITASGWDYLQKNKTNYEAKNQAFVAMSFSPELRPIYDNAIFPAIKSTGHRPYRVDSTPHIDRIDVKIISEIKNSKFMVADVTEQKAGVYYEAGFAQGLGIPVIWSVRKDHLDRVHFDTRQYNHIVWGDEEELRNGIESFILATIGKI